MLGAYVCRQCRARLSQRIAPVRTPQWQRRAASSFTSLRPRNRQDNPPSPPQEEERTPPQSQQEDVQEAPRDGPRIRKDDSYGQTLRTGGRYSRHARDEDGGAPTRTDDGWDTRNTALHPDAPSYGEQGYAQAIKELLDARQTSSAWQLFEQTYTSRDCKALTDPPLSDIELLKDGKIFEKLLNYVNSSFCRGSKLDLTPTAAIFKYEQLGISNRELWYRSSLLRLTSEVTQAINASSDKPQRDLPSLLQELLSLWRLFFQCKGTRDDPLKTISLEWQLPANESLPDMFLNKDFISRLQDYCPRFVTNATLGYCAVYLYTISNAFNEEIRQQAVPFLRFLERLLAASSVSSVYKHMDFSEDFKKLPNDIRVQILHEIDEAPRTAMAAIGSSGATKGTEATGDAATNLEKFYIRRIARAIDSKTSSAMLDRLWAEIEGQYTSQDKTKTIPSKIYNAFLTGYMVTFNPQRSVEVWNHMIAQGVRPDMRSWVALLEGCAKGRDLNGLNAMWTRMLNTGLEPDNYAWTTRVNGLMSLGSINQALMALDDMGNRWLSAEAALNSPPTHSKGHKGPRKLPSSSKAVNRCTKPSIEVINGAISALLRKKTVRMSHERRVKYVSDLLKWSANFQIRPDAYTYNNLIRLYMQGGDTATAYKILTQMERDGVQGDITTHNMLIAAAFDNGAFDGLTPDQQTTRILSIFNDLQAEGMKMSDTVYGTVIDRLLKDYDNYTTVLAVMSHMTERNFVPTAHTYTSFLTHYFQADPPNIRAVDGLVHYLFTSKRTHTDKVLYDRLIEGYARFGEVGSMMMVLVRMSKEGLQPGWDALTSAINALVHAGDYERARMVVRDVERGEGVAQGGIVGVNHGQHVFWATVRALGIDMDEARMGEFMSGGGGVLAERMDDWEGRKEPERGQFDQPSGQSRYEQEPGSVDYEREPGSVDFDPQQEPGQYAPELVYEQPQYEAAGASRVPPAMELPREPGAVAPEDEEDVHGFLTDEPEIEQKRQQRP